MAEEKKQRTIDFITSPVLFKQVDGKKFIKEIIYEGEFANPTDPSKKMIMNEERFSKWVTNYKAGKPDIVYVPLNHSDNPADNTGVIEDLFIGESENYKGKKALFAKFSIALADIAEKIGKTILGCSIGVERYFSPDDGADCGEILGHVALTNEPYIQHLGDFTEVAFSKNPDIKINQYVLMREERKHKPTEDTNMTDAEKLEMTNKIAELERANKEALESVELARKEKEANDVKIAEMEKVSFERELTSEIEKLVLSKKVIPADKSRHFEFAKKLGKDMAREYLANLSKNADVVDTGVITHSSGKAEDVKCEKPKLSELNEVFAGFLQKKISLERSMEACKDWEKRYEANKGAENDISTEVKFKRAKSW